MGKDEYYEEKQIGLTTYYRLHPAFDWREMSNKDLTKKINELQSELKRVRAELSSVPQANELLPHVMGMYCHHCGSDDIVWYGLSGDCVCNKCGEEGNITP